MQIWQDEWIILGTIDKTIDLSKIQDGDEILIMILVGLGGVLKSAAAKRLQKQYYSAPV